MASFPRVIPLVVASALFMENTDGTVIATSLPAIAADLGEDPLILKLAFTTYLLALTVFIPVSGWCADRFGARNVFRAAIAVFTLGSIACGLSTSLEGLIAARALQGIGGAMMVPVGRLIILRTVSKSEMVSALALLTIPALMGPLLGPPLGGFITTYFNWRWIFWINVPVGLLGLALQRHPGILRGALFRRQAVEAAAVGRCKRIDDARRVDVFVHELFEKMGARPVERRARHQQAGSLQAYACAQR